MSHEKEVDSILTIAAFPSLSHKLISENCSGDRLEFESTVEVSVLHDLAVCYLTHRTLSA